jgi:nucleotide-binding universal stress UspA family protein
MPKPLYVIATDLSRESHAAAAVAARIAERTRARLEFFCALPANVADEYGVDVHRARAAVAAVAQRHASGTRPARANVALVNDVPGAILRHVRSEGAALLVVAPRGRTGWKRVLLGGTTERILRDATGSVLVARTPVSGAIRRILVGIDRRTPAGEATLRHAIALARVMRAPLTVIHVVRPAELLLPIVSPVGRRVLRGGVPLSQEAQSLEAWAPSFPHRGVAIDVRVVEGSPAEKLAGEVRRGDAELVVVGASDKSRVKRALLGSVAYAVAATSPVSVMVVRAS